MKKFKALFAFGFMTLLFSLAAQAAQTGQVIVPSANVYQYPSATAKVVAKLSQGESVPVSNVPTEGFYKTRLPSGDIGWVSGNDILSNSGGTGAAVSISPTATVQAPRRRRSRDEVNGDDSFRAILAYGVSSLSYAGLADNYVDTKGLNLGSDLGLELQFRMNRKLYWAVRLEIISGNTGAQTTTTNVTQQTTIKEVPVELGLMWSPVSSHRFRWGFGAYVGIVPSANATITQINSNTSTPIQNQVVYQTWQATGTLATQFSIGLGDVFGILLDLAYRYDQTGTTPNTNVIGTVPGFKINYSGVTARLGLELRL